MSDRPRKRSRITRSRSSASALAAATPSLSSNTTPAEQPLAILQPPLDAQHTAPFSPPSPTTATENTHNRNEKYGLFRLQPVLTTTSDNERAATNAVDIVAVHGITGDAYGTWTHENGTLWLRDLIPKDLPGVRVFSYGYPAKVFFTLGTGGLEDFSRGLLEGLRGERRGKEYEKRPIIFVCHSMGGIVVKKALIIAKIEDRRFEDILMSVKSIMFLATPHRGSSETQYPGMLASIANLAMNQSGATRLFGRSRSDLIKTLEKDSQILLDISTDFRNQMRNIKTASAIEQNLTPPAKSLIVERSSALMNVPDEIILPMHDCDHSSICRFDGAHSWGYKAIVNVLQDWLDELEKMNDSAKTDEDLECLQSLGFPEIPNRRQDADKALPQTCSWILRHKSYMTWRDKERGMLWINGKPGSGKSTLMAFIYKSFQEYSTSSNDLLLDFFFHARGTLLQKTPIGMFRSMLHQVYDKVPAVRSQVSAAFKQKRKFGATGTGWQWQLKELQDLFSAAIVEASKSRSITIFVDALDEAGSKTASDLLIYFHDLYENNILPEDATAKFCISCRKYPRLSTKTSLNICVDDENHHDIVKYIKDRLSRLSGPGTAILSVHERKTLAQTIVRRASGVFLWTVLIIRRITKYIEDGCPFSFINQKLWEVPEGLSEVYENIIKTVILPEYRPKTYLLMQWVCVAREPLSVTELRYAFSCDDLFQSENFESNYTDVHMKAQISSWSGGLVEFKHYRNKTIVQVMHHSVLDYLQSDGLKYLAASSNTGLSQDEGESTLVSTKLILGKSQQRLCKSCVNYLQRQDVLKASQTALPTNLYEREEIFLKTLPFIHYATRSWFRHAEQAESLGVLQEDLIQQFRSRSGLAFDSWVKIFRAIDAYNPKCPNPGAKLLHVACSSNLRSVVKILLSDPESIHAQDDAGNRPLDFAAQWGHLELVKTLLDAGADIYGKCQEEVTALVRAAGNEYKEISQLPTRRGAEANESPRTAGNALQAAAENGHKAVVQTLLEEGADVNAGNRGYDGTALLAACATGKEDIARLLLENRADTEAKNIDGETALLWAAGNGYEAIVQLLLDKGADIKAKDNHKLTALFWAARNGFEAVVRLLLSKGADITAKDGEGGTVLQHAAEHGSEAIIRLLLDKGADINATDNYGMTALLWTSQQRSEAAVRLLLKNGANIEARDNDGMTPLLIAALNGSEAIVRLLLEEGANLNVQENCGMSALHFAARYGSEAIIRLLLNKRANIEARDVDGWTALFWAADHGSEAVIRLLLENKVNVNAKDRWGKTALLLAVQSGSEAVVRLLTPLSLSS
ncbi:Ankyrin repeat-containing domain protein [Hyaloscypha variabilis]